VDWLRLSAKAGASVASFCAAAVRRYLHAVEWISDWVTSSLAKYLCKRAAYKDNPIWKA
jgi:hypothetical protein